jgi:hypothetical protein
MIRALAAILFLVCLTVFVAPLRAEDNPLLREVLAKAIKKELSKRQSEATGWTSDKKEQQRLKVGPINGSIQTHLKTWIWLDDPAKNLTVEVTRFEMKDGRVTFAANAKGKLSGKAWGKAPPVVEGDVKASADAVIRIEGTARPKDDRFIEAEVTSCKAAIRNLNFNNDVLKVLRGPIEDYFNASIRNKEAELKRHVKEAIETFRP